MNDLAQQPINHAAEAATQDPVDDMLSRWGWRSPPPEVVTRAQFTTQMQNRRVGEIALEMGLWTAEQRDSAIEQWLTTPPLERDYLLRWAASRFQIPDLVTRESEIMAYQHGYQFIDNPVEGMELHPAMNGENRSQPIVDECLEKDVLLMRIEGRTPALVFPSYARLLEWQAMDELRRNMSAIYTWLQESAELNQLTLVIATNEVNAKLAGKIEDGDAAPVQIGEGGIMEHRDLHRADQSGVRKLAKIFDIAISRNDTDISLILHRNGTASVFTRVATDLYPFEAVPTLSAEEMHQLCSFALFQSGANRNASRPRYPTGGRITYQSQTHRADVRCSFIPQDFANVSKFAVSVSFRLLIGTGEDELIRLRDLHLNDVVYQAVTDALKKKDGFILVCGPTNSGKSTTCAGVIGEHQAVYGTRRKRVSIENPVERQIKDVIQFSITEGSEHTFKSFFAEILRHDPDQIFIGEIRDEESAATAVDAAISGHNVISTTHANNTLLAYRRLLNYTGEQNSFDLVNALALIIGQRLVKQVCPNCYVETSLSEEEKQAYIRYLIAEGEIADTPEATQKTHQALPDTVASVSGHSCDNPKCQNGVAGMLPVNEVMTVPRELKEMLLDGVMDLSRIDKFRLCTLSGEAQKLLQQHKIAIEDAYL